MGLLISRAMEALSGTKQKRIVVLGLDAAGKTTILYKLNLNETVTTIPTIGFNVEAVKYKNINFTCWDIGGQKKIRALWHHYYHDTDAVIFVVDSNDRDRIDEAAEELHSVMTHDLLRNAVLLVYANKQDLPNSLTLATIAEKMHLHSKYRSVPWHIQATTAISGEGLYEGLDWLSVTLSKSRQSHA